MQGTKNLVQGSITKQLFRLAMPIMATSFVQMAYSLTDMAWVGRLGSEAVAAVGAVGILTWMTSSFALLAKVGAEVSVGQAVGVKSEEAAKGFASHSVMMALFLSLLWAVGLFAFAEPIMRVYQLDAHIAVRSITYLRIICTAFPFVFVSTAFTGIYNAAGKSSMPFYINASGLIVNMILDPLFIFAFGWGTAGAAYATWLAQAFVCLLFIFRLKGKNPLLGGFPFFVRLQAVYVRRIFKIGFPVAVLNMLFASVNMIMSRFASVQGGHIGLMTLTTGGQIEAITWNTSQGFSTALAAFSAQNYAAGRVDRVVKAFRSTLGMTLIFGVFATCLFVFFGEEVFSVFVPEPAAFISGGVYLQISGYSQLFMMLEITTQGLFYGVGRTIPPAVISITCNYLRIPLALFFIAQGMGVAGIWWAVSISCVLKGVASIVWFVAIKKRIFAHRVNLFEG